jgi:hypothetical protein
MIIPAALLDLAASAAGAAAFNVDPRALDACPRGASGEIVVCGSRDRQSKYRLPRLAHEYDRRAIHPEAVVPGGRIHVESERRPDGLVDKRIMITFGLPF